MNERIRYGRFPAGNPVANALMAIAGALAIGAAIVFGLLVFLFVAGIVVVLAGIVGIRIWWVSRRLRKLRETAAKTGAGGRGDQGIIEGEYHVVTKRHRRERR